MFQNISGLMESKLIDQINQNYIMILNILKRFLKENFIDLKLNSQKYKSFEKDILNTKSKDIPKFINEYSNQNSSIFNNLEKIKVKINELINENINNKNKIIENMNESLYLIKHPQQCLFLMEVEKNNNKFLNYLNLIESEVNIHKYENLETIHYVLSNIRINYN